MRSFSWDTRVRATGQGIGACQLPSKLQKLPPTRSPAYGTPNVQKNQPPKRVEPEKLDPLLNSVFALAWASPRMLEREYEWPPVELLGHFVQVLVLILTMIVTRAIAVWIYRRLGAEEKA